MRAARITALVVALAMGAASALAVAITPRAFYSDQVGKPELPQLFPAMFADWRIDSNMPVVLPAADVQAKLDAIYNQVLARTYVNSKGERIMLSVAYGGDQSDGTRAHRPEVCYPAQGFEVSSSSAATLNLMQHSLQVRHLNTRLGPRSEPLTYWVVVGDQVTTSALEQKLAQLRYGLHGLIPDGMLVRISSIDADADHAYRVQAQFIDDLAVASTEEARVRVFGRTFGRDGG